MVFSYFNGECREDALRQHLPPQAPNVCSCLFRQVFVIEETQKAPTFPVFPPYFCFSSTTLLFIYIYKDEAGRGVTLTCDASAPVERPATGADPDPYTAPLALSNSHFAPLFSLPQRRFHHLCVIFLLRFGNHCQWLRRRCQIWLAIGKLSAIYALHGGIPNLAKRDEHDPHG